jgi:hypothetical protein
MKRTVFLLSVLFFSIVLIRCSPDDICLSNQNAVQVGFYSAYSETDKDTTLSDLSVFGVGRSDSLLYRNVAVNKLFLPLSMHVDTTAFLLKVSTLQDTLWLAYKRRLSYVSGNCGMAVEITVDTMWFNGRFIDSVAIVQPLIKYNENVENIKLYID